MKMKKKNLKMKTQNILTTKRAKDQVKVDNLPALHQVIVASIPPTMAPEILLSHLLVMRIIITLI